MNACARIVVLALACCPALSAVAQDKQGKHDDLDVTMQIIVDPNAKLPDEVVRHIPLPTSRTTPSGDSTTKSPAPADTPDKPDKPDKETKEQERAQDARELGREAAETAKERAREAAEQREEARNSDAKDPDKDNEHGRPDRPNPPHPRN